MVLRPGKATVLIGIWGALVAGPVPAAAQLDEHPCRPHLVHCNSAEHFSGTLHRRSVLEVQSDKQVGGLVSTIIEDLTVEVTDGRAVCRGSARDREEGWSSGRMESRHRRGGVIQGEGLLAVELGRGTEDSEDQPWVRISIACPTAAGEDTTETFRNGGSLQVQRFASRPPEMDSNGWVTEKLATSADYLVMTGRVSEEAPEADPSNGVTGTVTFEWSLTRKAAPAARKPARR